jgi:hypothetical protein
VVIAKNGVPVARLLKLWSDTHRETPVDVFVYEPFDFDQEYECALQDKTMGANSARFVAIPALIAMKVAAGRDRDLIDIEKLRQNPLLQMPAKFITGSRRTHSYWK